MDVRERANALRALPIEQLRQLPESGEEEVETLGALVLKYITWHDELPSGEHRIVVASYEPRGLAGYMVQAAGFAIAADGTKRELTPEEMNPFV